MQFKYILAAAILAPLLIVGALESQWPSYADYLARKAPAGTDEDEGTLQRTIDDALDPETGSLTLLAMGDIADCPERTGLASAFPVTSGLFGLPAPFEPASSEAVANAELAKRQEAAPILALGDLAYNSGKPVEFSECFDPLWGGLRERTLPTPGNHEYKTPDAFGYYDYWGARAGPDGRGYYAVQAGNWLILSLNSEIDATPRSEQARWLDEALAKAPDACVLAFYHRPAWSLEPRGGRSNAVELFARLQQARTTLVLNGHNHFYEWTVPLDGEGKPEPNRGTIAFTVGTGGKTTGEKSRLPTTAAAFFGRQGMLRIELLRDSFHWKYEDVSNSAELDAGSAQCASRSD